MDTEAMETLIEGVVQPSVYIKQEIQVGLSCACTRLCRVCLWRVFVVCDRQHVLLFVCVCVRVVCDWMLTGGIG